MRRILCFFGWHSTEVVGYSPIFGNLHRCAHCGEQDFELDWLFIRRPK